MAESGKFRILLCTSLLIAATIVVVPRFFVFMDTPVLFLWTYFLGAIWLALALAGIWRFRARGLWLLVGLPFVAFWPVAFALLARACVTNPNACL